MHIIDKLTIAERVKLIIAEQLRVNEDEVTPGALIGEDLGADSLDAIELVMELDESFSLDITDEDAEKLKTVQDVVDMVERKVKP